MAEAPDYRRLWQARRTKRLPNVCKAFAYVTRTASSNRFGRGLELLVFAHDDPASGVQVPKGTVEVGETPAEAARREVLEECGVQTTMLKHIATDVVHFPNDPANTQVQRRHFYRLRPSVRTPERWIHRVGGAGEDNAMRFTCFWLPLSECSVLIANMGDYLHLLE